MDSVAFLILFQCFFLVIHCGTRALSSIAIDFGNEWIKVAVLRRDPAVFFEVALDDQSSRKIPAYISFHDGHRSYGNIARNLLTRKPFKVFRGPGQLLGVPFDQFSIPSFQGIRAAGFGERLYDEDNKIVVRHPEDETLKMRAEDLVAMLLLMARESAAKHVGVPVDSIYELVVSIPSSFTPVRRRALQDAAELANLTLVAVVEDVLAASVAYAYDHLADDKRSSASHRIAVIDIGAGSCSVAIVEFPAGQETMKILSHVHNDALSGAHFDLRLAHFALQKVPVCAAGESSGPRCLAHALKEVGADARASARLLRETRKVKEILSVNKVADLTVENLLSDFDLRMRVHETDFRGACSDLLAQLKQLLESAIAEAKQTSQSEHLDVNFVEIIGGGTRVPAVQDVIKQVFAKDVSYHVNSDEGCLLGAAYVAVGLARDYPYPVRKALIDAAILNVSSSEESDESQSRHLLSEQELSDSQNLLLELARRDSAVLRRSEKRNDLESFIISTLERLDEMEPLLAVVHNGDGDAALKKDSLRDALVDAREWLDDNPNAEEKELKGKLVTLVSSTRDVLGKVDDLKARLTILDKLKKLITEANLLRERYAKSKNAQIIDALQTLDANLASIESWEKDTRMLVKRQLGQSDESDPAPGALVDVPELPEFEARLQRLKKKVTAFKKEVKVVETKTKSTSKKAKKVGGFALYYFHTPLSLRGGRRLGGGSSKKIK